MNIYHTCASRPDVEKARETAPSFTHGYGWIPEKMCRHDDPYFVDNGAFKAHADGEQWSPEPFFSRLAEIEDRMPRDPDFVVLPDIYQDGLVSLARSAKYADMVDSYDVPYYLPVQDELEHVEGAVRAAIELGASGVFIGGSDAFKKEYADQFCMTAHDYDLRAHIGKPGPRLTWARDVGADSVDTASIVRNGYWSRLEKLEAAPETREVDLTEACYAR